MVILGGVVWLAWLGMALAAPAINTDRYEGDSCPLANGAGNGVCRHHASCTSLKTIPQKDWVTCSFDRDQPIVCCQDVTGPVPTALNTVLVQRFSSVSERMCDSFPPTSALTNHIFNGIEAALNEFPYIAALGYPAKGEETPFRCGASLISERFLLTAAHCLSPQKPIYARLGVVKLFDYDPLDPPVNVGIKQTYIHPNYTGRPLKNDIALLLLNRTIDFNKTESFLQPACLFTNYTDPDFSTLLTIAGWGSIDPNDISTSETLLKANVTTLLRDTCNSTLAQNKSSRRSPNELQESQLCALGRNAQNETTGDTCVGDSGGPLELADGRRRYLVGVTSSGKLCGSRWPGIYTRVSRYLDWIESVVWPPGGVVD